MKPLKGLFNVLKFFYTDTKTDIQWVIKFFKGEAKIRKFTPEELQELTLANILKENWIMFLLITLAFFVGWFVSAKYYQQTCNVFIYETYIKPHAINWTQQTYGFALNLTNKSLML